MHTDIPFGKILRPTAEEFADFAGYLDKVEKSNPYCGVFKIIPPKKWKPANINYDKDIDDLVVSHPIEQNVYGKGGIYELLLIQRKSMRVREYKKKVESFDKLTDNKSIEAVEEIFWKNVAFSPPLYGADIKGSLFDDDVEWDLKNLPGLLSDGLRKKISGVNEPYLYIGSWKTMFGWHKEDMDLYSINYLHCGKPKFWYCLPREEGYKLEQFAKQVFSEAFSKCKEYLRHKTIMISPYVLKQKIPDLKIHKMIHNPGEFVITMGGSYHAGFNWGFNVAEAVNFALPKWLDILPTAHACRCMNDTVKIDQVEFMKNLDKKKINGKKGDIDEESDTSKRNRKSSSSTKLTHKKSEVYSLSHSSRKILDSSSNMMKNKRNVKRLSRHVTKRRQKTSETSLMKKIIPYEYKGATRSRNLVKLIADIDENSRILRSSRKIRKDNITNSKYHQRKTRSQTMYNEIGLDDKFLKKLKEMLKVDKDKDIIIEIDDMVSI